MSGWEGCAVRCGEKDLKTGTQATWGGSSRRLVCRYRLLLYRRLCRHGCALAPRAGLQNDPART